MECGTVTAPCEPDQPEHLPALSSLSLPSPEQACCRADCSAFSKLPFHFTALCVAVYVHLGSFGLWPPPAGEERDWKFSSLLQMSHPDSFHHVLLLSGTDARQLLGSNGQPFPLQARPKYWC